MSMRCLIGLHKWKYTQHAQYETTRHEDLALPSVEAERTCQRCGQVERRDEHLLGLNPPAKSYHWYKVNT